MKMLLIIKLFESIKLRFSEKGSTHNKMVEQYFILDKNDDVAEVLNSFFYQCVNVPAIFYQNFIFLPNDSPLKTMENVFYFI